MAEFPLETVFGAGATQDFDSFTIPKASLEPYGLTATGSNSAESLLYGLILKASETLTEMARLDDRPNRHVTLTRSPFDVLEDPPGSGLYFRRDIVTIIGYSEQPANPINIGAFDQG